MAAFGAKYINFAKIDREEKGKLPTYGSEKISLGLLVKADLTVNFATGEMYADDRLAEKMEEFVSGSLAVEVDELEDKDASIIYGSKINGQGEKTDNTGDSAPYGGVAYYKSLSKDNKKFYRGYFYPKARAALGNDNAATKSNSITFATTPITFTVYEPENGDWRYTKRFDTEEEARAWVDAKLSNREPEEKQSGSETAD
ncbi:MAG: hypothetical protein NC432_08795 [Roseburia sp.]|nr:hypothetical protein [Roseburia sp.]MCM1097789.1 hypothetical protein [Ruminococcus flavefaciens]